MMDEQFQSLTGFHPAKHQRECAEFLAQGKSVILRAPTGSGKSEAVWLPFLYLRGENLPMRMIHALPMRALVNQLEQRLREYVTKLPGSRNDAIRVAAMHGKRSESVLFYADAIVSTLDQVVTSYACAPLSLSVRHGNIPAGAIPGSFLVFDEVHTFEPQLGLQAVLVLAERAVKIGIPFVIMSATLPEGFLSLLVDRFGDDKIAFIEGQRLQLAGRSERHVELKLCPEPLTSERVLEHARQGTRTLVVVNRVDHAQKLYEEVREHWECPILLAHARFYDDDRHTKETQIETLFGKKAVSERCLMIATQVIEVGLDISCDVLLTELAPIDALLQRAGRCVRWGGDGRVVVFTGLETKRPYMDGLVDDTLQALQEFRVDGQALTWDLERALVDKILDPYFNKWAEPTMAGKVLASLAEAAFTGNSSKAERAVRDTVSVEVALHDNPENLGPHVLQLPRCRLHPGVFQKFVRDERPRAWQVVVDREPIDDWRVQVECFPVSAQTGAKLMAGGYYVVHPQSACYDSERGLRLGIAGEPARPHDLSLAKDRLVGASRKDLWPDHIAAVVRSFEQHVLPKERMAFEALARWLEVPDDKLLTIVKLTLIFHDLGKLTREWQHKILSGLENTPGSFLAHRGDRARLKEPLPPHATVSAWVATPCVVSVAGYDWEETLAVPSLAAVAHHHSVRADLTPQFEMADGWFPVVAQSIQSHTGISVTPAHFNTKGPLGNGSCGVHLNLLAPEAFTAYVLLSRWLRLADRMATGGGEETILQYEEWLGDS